MAKSKNQRRACQRAALTLTMARFDAGFPKHDHALSERRKIDEKNARLKDQRAKNRRHGHRSNPRPRNG